MIYNLFSKQQCTMLAAFICCIIFIITAAAGLFHWYLTCSSFFKKFRKIPGPPGLPLLGDAVDVFQSQDKLFLCDRIRALEYYPICRQTVLHEAMVSIYSPEDIEIILSSTKHLEKGKLYKFLHCWLETGLLTSTGAKWQSRRKILTPAFHFSILQDFVSTFNEGTAQLLEVLSKRSHEPYVDVTVPITEFTLFSLAESSMGIKLNASNYDNKYKNAVYEFGKNMAYRMVRPWLFSDFIFNISPAGKKSKNLVETLHGFSRSVIEERKRNKDMSYSTRKKLAMLDLLLTAKENGADIDDEGIREEVDTFMFEGHDTTSMAICFILLVLANHKKVQEEIRSEIFEVLKDKLPTYADLHQELKYTEMCVKECLRLYPSVPFIARKSAEDIETASGYVIPKNTNIHIHIYDLHHSPHVFPDPERFDPDRFLPENIKSRHPFAFIPFSAGQRNCIGQRFAMLELKAVLCGILRRFTLEPVDKPEDVVFMTDLVLRPKNGIKVKFVPRT